MPQTKNFTARLPPHVHRELYRLFADVPAHFKTPSVNDLIGTLVLRARRSPEGLLDDLASYIDHVRDPWEKQAVEQFPEQ